MYLLEGCVVDVPMLPEIQVELIECFRNDNQLILFTWLEPNERDFKRLEEMNEKYDNIIEYKKFVLTDKEPLFITEEECGPFNRKELRTIHWYSPDTWQELIEIIKDEGITYHCYIVPKDSDPKDFLFDIHLYEHHEVGDTEYRSLFYSGKGIESFREYVLPKLEAVVTKYNSSDMIRGL
jgi:hypothetical protein